MEVNILKLIMQVIFGPRKSIQKEANKAIGPFLYLQMKMT